MRIKKKFIIGFIIIILVLIINILTLIFSVWTNKSIKICFYIYFSVYCVSIITMGIPILFFKITSDLLMCMKNIFILIDLVFLIFFMIEFITFSVNISNYKKYLKQCPFALKKINYNMHLNKRCELYNINNYSRYTYQYICSYDSSKDFNYNLKKKRKNDVVICIPFETVIENNDIVSSFYNEYKDSKIYYCSRTKKTPDNYYEFINPKTCNNKVKYSITSFFFAFSLSRFLMFGPYIFFFFIDIYKYLEEELINERAQLDRQINNYIRNNVNNLLQDNVERMLRQRRLIALDALIGGLLDLLIGNPVTISRCSTNIEEDENNNNINNNDNNDIEKTRNIIIENKNEYSIDVDIKNYSLNKVDKLSHSRSINLSHVNFDFVSNSEESKINNNIQKENGENNI